MPVYLGIALGAVLLSVMQKRASNHIIKGLLICSLVVWLSFFAGRRAFTVGTDTLVYGIPSLRVATSNSFTSFFFESYYSTWAPLAKVFIWIAANATHSSFWFLFLIETVIVVPVVCSIHLFCDEMEPLAIFVYCLLFFPMSFNMMRQMMAMGFVLIAIYYAVNNRIVPFVVWISIAIGFHTSTAVALFIYPLVRLAQSSRASAGLKLLLTAVLLAALLSLIFMEPKLFAGVGVYDSYLIDGRLAENGSISIFMMTLLYVIAATVLFLMCERNRFTHQHIFSLLVIILLGMALLLLTVVSKYLYRVGLVFIYILPVYMALMSREISDGRSYLVFCLSVSMLSFGWSYGYYDIQGNHEVIPYSFSSGDMQL